MRLLACVTVRGPSREPYRKHGLFHERTSGARVCGPSFRKDSHVTIVYDPLPYNSYTKNLYTSEWTVRSGHIPYSWTIIQWIGSLNSCQNHLSNSKSVLAGASLNVPVFFWSWAASLSLTRDDCVTLHQKNREWRRQATPTVSTPRRSIYGRFMGFYVNGFLSMSSICQKTFILRENSLNKNP